MLDSIEDAINDIRAGRMIIIIDDEDRENEGDLVFAADVVTPEKINFMATHGRGLICTSITKARAEQLNLSLMVDDNTCPYETGFTVSVDARHDTSTGISASDRSITTERLVDESFGPDAFVRPGHMFPLIAKDGGVLERQGQTEASVDIAKLAGFRPAGVICEIMNDDGTMARLPELRIYAQKHDLKIISIADMITYIKKNS